MGDDSFGDDSFDERDQVNRGGNDDFDDSFDNDFGGAGADPMAKSQLVSNQPYDEAVALSEDDSVDSLASPNRPAAAPAAAPAPAPAQAEPAVQAAPQAEPAAAESQQFDNYAEQDNQDDSLDQSFEPSTGHDASAVYPSMASATDAAGMPRANPSLPDEDRDADDDSSSDDDDESTGGGAVGMSATYDPSEYDNLQVGADVKELFQYIERYKPHQIELDTRLKPFVPEYIPAVGDIDAFLKVPRPDNKAQESHQILGLGILDEPAAMQSDPTVLDLQLRQKTKKANLKEASVRSVESADKNPQALTQWINSINELHRTKPQPTVIYNNSMPSLDHLMQAWPHEFEELLGKVELPTAELDMDLPQFVTTLCSILDIPVYEGKLTQSLHMLFTLFSEFKANPHYAMYGDGGVPDQGGGDFGMIAGTDTTFTGE
jgi:intraflagellar transport protein 46